MKVAPLLAEFFLAHKRLDLPGIGSFTLAANEQPEQANFESNPAIKESPELVEYIASNSGKIKALAAADLDSHLELARQFLNIGKPFLFEGIGSLVKQQSGGFSFVPGAPVTEKANPRAVREPADTEYATTASEGFKSIFYAPKARTSYRKTLFIFLLIAGVGLAIWGGYTVYKKTTSKDTDTLVENTEPEQKPAEQEPVPVQTAAVNTPVAKDTSATIPRTNTSIVSTPPGNFKFVVETADKTRGLARYQRLKGFGLDVKMETQDSVSFKIFFLVPAIAMDTTRILDSLRRQYTPAGGMAYIDK